MQDPQSEQEVDLTTYLDVLLRRRWIVLACLAASISVSVLYAFTATPIYQATALVLIEKERGGNSVYANGALVESSNDDYYQTQYRLLKSESLLGQVYTSLRLDQIAELANPEGVEKLEKRVTVAAVLRSRLVQVRVTSLDAPLAAKISNAIATHFVEQNLQNQLFISKEILQALQAKGGSAEARRMHEALPAVVNNPLIQNLKGDYAKLQAQIADMSSRYTEKHPLMTSLRGNLQALERQIALEMDRVVQSLKTELSGQLKGNNVRVVDFAKVPRKPIRPKKVQLVFLGTLVGVILGLALAFLVEMVDQSTRNQDDVEKKLRQPFLGMIPQTEIKVTEAPYTALLTQQLSVTSEAFRSLRTMIDFAGVSGQANTILLTSAVQEEGKSFVSVNLAVVFAQLGERVLIIDGDLRRPTLHRNLRISNERGVSEFLASGKSIDELDSLVQQTHVPNLTAMTCGVRPPNPSELLSTPRVTALINWAQSKFDRVILDCTPIYPISDTLLWGKHIRSAVFVVSYGKVRTPLVLKAIGRAQTGGLKLLGVAINGARPGGLSYSNRYYYQQYYQAYRQEHTTAG